MDERVGYNAVFRINITMPISDGSSMRCGPIRVVNFRFLKTGTHPFAMGWVWSLKGLNSRDQKAVEACSSFNLAGWGHGEANVIGDSGINTDRNISATMQTNTTIVCSQ